MHYDGKYRSSLIQLWFFDPTSSFSAETRAIKTCAYPKKLLFGPLRLNIIHYIFHSE